MIAIAVGADARTTVRTAKIARSAIMAWSMHAQVLGALDPRG